MFHRSVQANFLINYGKFRVHASKIYTKFPCNTETFPVLQRTLEKHLRSLQNVQNILGILQHFKKHSKGQFKFF